MILSSRFVSFKKWVRRRKTNGNRISFASIQTAESLEKNSHYYFCSLFIAPRDLSKDNIKISPVDRSNSYLNTNLFLLPRPRNNWTNGRPAGSSIYKRVMNNVRPTVNFPLFMSCMGLIWPYVQLLRSSAAITLLSTFFI